MSIRATAHSSQPGSVETCVPVDSIVACTHPARGDRNGDFLQHNDNIM